MFNEYDEFDLALALYHWLRHNWQGQADALYSDFCRLTEPGMFNPGMAAEYFENIGDEAEYIYGELTIDNYGVALKRVLNYEPSDV